jgi:hypothetical protein
MLSFHLISNLYRSRSLPTTAMATTWPSCSRTRTSSRRPRPALPTSCWPPGPTLPRRPAPTRPACRAAARKTTQQRRPRTMRKKRSCPGRCSPPSRGSAWCCSRSRRCGRTPTLSGCCSGDGWCGTPSSTPSRWNGCARSA